MIKIRVGICPPKFSKSNCRRVTYSVEMLLPWRGGRRFF
jgi:hypothetical protein